MIMKKRVALMMAMLMIMMSFMTACSKKAETTETATTTEAATTETETVATNEPPTEITVSFMTFGQTPPDMQLVEDAVNEISLKEINVKVKFLPIGIGGYNEQINLMLTSGEKLDAMSLIYFAFPGYLAKNQLLPMDDLLNQYGQDIVSSLGPTYIKSGVVNGQTYAVTTNRDLAGGTGLVMRKDILDKYGFKAEDIKSLADAEAVFKVVKENEPGMAPLAPSVVGGSIMISYRFFDPLTDGIGVLDNYGNDDSFKVVNLAETQTYKDMLTTVRDWYEKGYILSDATTTQTAGPQLVSGGKAFSYIAPTKPELDSQESGMAGTEMVIADLLPAAASTTSMQTFQWALPSTCENPEKTMQFLNLMYKSPEINNLLSWGIEGKHYVVQEDQSIDYPEGVDASNTGFALHSGWQFGNQFLTHVWSGDAPDLWSQMKTFNDGAIKSKAIGFTYISDNIKNELVACTNVQNQYKVALESGAVDPATVLPEYLKALKDAGIDKIIAEKQAQLDAWVAAGGQ